MAEQGQSNVAEREENSSDARSLAIAEGGIRTGAQFANLMSALMSDILAGRVTPQVGNAACNAGGKLLKIVEMQMQYGQPSGTRGDRMLVLAPEPSE